MKWATQAVMIVVFVISPAAVSGRTIVVATDGSGDSAHIWEATEVALAGDSVLFRDGDYYFEEFSVDSAVVVFAENHGAARIWGTPGIVIQLNGSAEVIGFQIIGNSMGIGQVLAWVEGGPAVVDNCEFIPAARFGWQLYLWAKGHAPIVQHCRFYLSGSNRIAENIDSTDIWMPHNCYGTMDTATIHWSIRDGHDYPGRGYITVSPVADTFEWLAVDPYSPVVYERQIELYPNPSHGMICIDLTGMQTIRQIDVFNILGQRVWELSDVIRPRGEHLKFDLPLPSGSYFISVHEPRRCRIARLTIIR